jgi:secretion/DNA translocation related TadE-like protein
VTADDRGVATVWVAWAIAALVAVVGLMLLLGAATVTRHRAAAAADLSALAAAAYGPWGEEFACRQARWVSERMSVRLAGCRLTGWLADVEVTVPMSGIGQATAHASAGPADS